MIWDFKQYQWDLHYAAAEVYFQNKGNLLVPYNYKVGEVRIDLWVKAQIARYHDGKLTEEQIIMLQRIGIKW